MDAATFGAMCSPESEQFAKNLNVMEHLQYPMAVKGILKSHYVYDYLDSFGSESEAKKLSAEVRLFLHNDGFNLRKWRLDSESITATLGESAKEDSKILKLESGEHVDRVLGMLWSSSTNELSFSTSMSEVVRHILCNGTTKA